MLRKNGRTTTSTTGGVGMASAQIGRCSECVQSVFRVCSQCVQSVFRVCSEWHLLKLVAVLEVELAMNVFFVVSGCP